MEQLIEELPRATTVAYLLDTCFIIHMIRNNHTHKLVEFCQKHDVGISSFTAKELVHTHKKLEGTLNHHIREFIKLKVVSLIPIPVSPGERAAEREFVNEFNPFILRLVRDPSDAILFVLALRLKAHLLTKDKHHLFTANAEHYAQQHGIEVLNELPH